MTCGVLGNNLRTTLGTLNFTDPGAMDRLRQEVAELLAHLELGTVEHSVGLAHDCR
jgi:hypothetical protein